LTIVELHKKSNCEQKYLYHSLHLHRTNTKSYTTQQTFYGITVKRRKQVGHVYL